MPQQYITYNGGILPAGLPDPATSIEQQEPQHADRAVTEGEDIWPYGEPPAGSNPLRLSFLFKSCGLWTLPSDFVLNETLKWLSSLPILMKESFWW